MQKTTFLFCVPSISLQFKQTPISKQNNSDQFESDHRGQTSTCAVYICIKYTHTNYIFFPIEIELSESLDEWPRHYHPTYWITQHLHLGFFFITTGSTSPPEDGETIVRWTSTTPALSDLAVPLKPFLGEPTPPAPPVPADSCDLSWTVASLSSTPIFSDPFAEVGVMGFPSLIRPTISSASRLRSPSGRNGLSHPLSVLPTKKQQQH